MANSWQTSTGEMLSVWELCWGKKCDNKYISWNSTTSQRLKNSSKILFNICASQSFWSSQPENTSSKRLPTVSLALTCATSAPVYSAACFPAECITPRGMRTAVLCSIPSGWGLPFPHHDNICLVAGQQLGFHCLTVQMIHMWLQAEERANSAGWKSIKGKSCWNAETCQRAGFPTTSSSFLVGKKNFRGNLPARLVQFCPSLKLCYWVYTVEKGSHVKERDPALEAMQ